MPNYVRNILQINAPPAKIEEVFNAIQSDTDPEQCLEIGKQYSQKRIRGLPRAEPTCKSILMLCKGHLIN